MPLGTQWVLIWGSMASVCEYCHEVVNSYAGYFLVHYVHGDHDSVLCEGSFKPVCNGVCS